MSTMIPIGKLNDELIECPDYADIPESSQRDAYAYGLKQYLNDGAASVVLVDRNKVRNPDYPDTPDGNARYAADVRSAVMVRLDKVRNGTMGVRSTADPMETVARRYGLTREEFAAVLERESAKKARKSA